MSRTKKAEIEIDLHPCPGKTVNGVKRYIESNLRRDPTIPLCILHVGTNDCSTRDRCRKTQGLYKIFYAQTGSARHRVQRNAVLVFADDIRTGNSYLNNRRKLYIFGIQM